MISTFDRVRAGLDIAATSAMIIAAMILAWGSWRDGAVAGLPTSINMADGSDISGQNLNVNPDPSHRMGVPSATVAVIEFADFECPYCALYAQNTLPRVRAELVEKGVVAYVFMHYPLDAIHKRAKTAAIAATCAAKQGLFWEIHSSLFTSVATLPTSGAQVEGLSP